MGELVQFPGNKHSEEEMKSTSGPQAGEINNSEFLNPVKLSNLNVLVKDLVDIGEVREGALYKTSAREIARYTDEQVIFLVNNFKDEDIKRRLPFYSALIEAVQERDI